MKWTRQSLSLLGFYIQTIRNLEINSVFGLAPKTWGFVQRKGFTYFSRDLMGSGFHEQTKNEFISLMNSSLVSGDRFYNARSSSCHIHHLN